MRFLFTLLLFSLVGVACSGGSEATATAERNTILVRGNGAEATNLDPAHADDIHSFNILIDAYEGLVTYDAAGNIIPGVAESWQISEDGLLYRFTLRDDARWSTGDMVVANDFARGFRHVTESNSASFYASLFGSIVNFSEAISGDTPSHSIAVTAESDTLLTIALSTPTQHFLDLLTLPTALPRHESGDHLVSNGAYRFKNKQNLGTIELVKNEHYWDSDDVYFDTVRYLAIVDEMAEFNMYRTGEIDVTHNIPDHMVQNQIETNGSEVKIAPSLAFYYYAFDTTEPPFDNKSLRKSLSLAIDRELITDLLGRGDAAAYSVVPPGVSNYEGATYEWSSEAKAKRIQTAKRLYEDAGYGDGNPLEITLLYDTGGIHEKVALTVSAMWKRQLGVETQLLKREWQYFLDSREQRGDWDVMRFAWFGDYNAPSTFLEIFTADSPQNLSQFVSDSYDAKLLTAASSRDQSAAAELMQSAEKILINDYPIVPIYFFVSKHLVDESIGGFETNVVDRHPSRYMHRRESTE